MSAGGFQARGVQTRGAPFGSFGMSGGLDGGAPMMMEMGAMLCPLVDRHYCLAQERPWHLCLLEIAEADAQNAGGWISHSERDV
jgi:hypothetical protein